MVKLGWPRRRRELPPVDPRQPHEFLTIDDPGLAAFAIGGGPNSRGWSIGAIATTDNFIRKNRCGVPGCGRERYDPIHEAGAD